MASQSKLSTDTPCLVILHCYAEDEKSGPPELAALQMLIIAYFEIPMHT